MTLPSPPPSRRTYAGLFPLPLVGASALLAVLIFLTPNLLSTAGPAAGSIETQAELILDRGGTNGSVTHVYLRGIGLVRYAQMAVAWGPVGVWPPPDNPLNLTWTNHTRGTGVLELALVTLADPFAVNVSATYVDASGAGVLFEGTYAFNLAADVVTVVAYGSATGVAPTPLTQLPLVLLLPESPATSGGP